MEKLLCPLLAAQEEQRGAGQECLEEKCAWYLRPDKDFGKPACAILKIGFSLLKK